MIDNDAQGRAASWLAAWDSQGIHRTGTAGDDAGSRWLAAEAQAMDVHVSHETFFFSRLDPAEACLHIGTQRFDGVPVFDAPPSPPDGIAGGLTAGPTSGLTGGPTGGIAGSPGPHGGGGTAIAVAALSPWVVYTDAYRTLRSHPGHAALAIVCQGAEPGLGLLNAEQFGTPYGCPAIHLPSQAHDAVMSAAAAGNQDGRLVAHSIRTPVTAGNVVVTLRGDDPARPPVVVMTPRSSWWQSASERGGGLVCWLETLRALQAAPPACDVILTANTGHELGHLGLDDFVARRTGWDRQGGATWIHYGANIGAAGGALSIMSADTGMRAAMQASLAAAGRAADTMAPVTQVPNGETRDIHRAGGRYLTLVGSSRLFHLPQDRYPGAVDIPAIARIAAGAARMVVALTR